VRSFGVIVFILPIVISNVSTSVMHIMDDEGWDIVVPDDYPSIQGVINHANPGDTIYVKAGVYHENVIVYKPVRIVGEDKDVVFVDGYGKGNVFYISADEVEITGLTIRNSSKGSTDNILSFSNDTRGNPGYYEDSWNVKITYDENNGINGVSTSNDLNNSGGEFGNSGFTCISNIWGDSFLVDIDEDVGLHSLIYCSNRIWVDRINYSGASTYISKGIVLKENIVQNIHNDLGFRHSINDDIYSGVLIYSKNVRIHNCNIVNNEDGISILGGSESTDNKIYNCYIVNNTCSGVSSAFSGSNKIYDCYISNNKYGFSFWECYNNKIYNCDIVNNGIGICIEGLWISHNNKICKCNVSNNEVGICFRGSVHSKIYNCNIMLNNEIGISLGGCHGNSILRNNFIGNFGGHASFSESLCNFWFRNYWDDWPGIIPRPIKGDIYLGFINEYVPWYTFDWYPALKPHDIDGSGI